MSIGPTRTRTRDGQSLDDLEVRIAVLEAALPAGEQVLSGLLAGEAIAVGELVMLSSGGVFLARATTSDCVVLGVAKTAASVGVALDIYVGGVVPILFGSAPAAATKGTLCYLSSTYGRATTTAPSLGPGVAWATLGVIVGADGADTSPTVLLRPGEPIYGA